MLTLKNNELTVEILDPVADREKMGTRFCTGAQIFQVVDVRHGPLLSGPTYPDSYNSFDSQGLPDGFTEYPGFETCAVGDRVMVIGVGLAHYTHEVEDIFPRVNREVAEWLSWQQEDIAAGIRFEARHDFNGFGYCIIREVTLQNRHLTVRTELANTAGKKLPVRWFAHPFYPFPPDGVAGKIPSDFQPNPAYQRGADDQMILCYTPDQGGGNPHQTFIEGHPIPPAEGPLVIPVNHPTLGTASVTCDFVVEALPCWYNEHTFSPEPYLADTLQPDTSTQWSIVYQF